MCVCVCVCVRVCVCSLLNLFALPSNVTFRLLDVLNVFELESLSDRPVLDDEAPQVVVLKSKDMSLDQVHDAMDGGASLGDVHLGTRVEPNTGDAGVGAEGGASNGDASNGVETGNIKKKKKTKKDKKKAGSKVPGAMSKRLDRVNTKMLSFDDNEEDDGW